MVILSVYMIGLGIALLAVAALLLADRGRISSGVASSCQCWLDHVITRSLVNYEHTSVFSSVVTMVLLLVMPGAAFLNALLGGSPLLFLSYLFLGIVAITLIILEENIHADLLRTVLSAVIAMMVFILLPLYAVWSLTVHMLNSAPAQAALGSLIIAVILYAAIAGGWTLFTQRHGVDKDSGPLQRFATMVLFAVPYSYVVYWFVLMGISTAGQDSLPLQTWTSLFCALITGALGIAVFKSVLDAALSRSEAGHRAGIFLSGGMGVLAITLGLALN